MFKTSLHFKKFYLYYLIILIIIYPASPILFDFFLRIKEPVFLSPIAATGPLIIRCDSYGDGHFNARRGNGTRKHKGLDLSAPVGAPVYAPKSGIAKTGCVVTGMGKYVKIIHPGGYSTMHGHLSKITVKDNQWVWQGAKIGEVGKTGNANYKRLNPHLHFEIRYKNEHLDPSKYIR
ncbi:MAG: M23 family metallopeptidase [Candidatus Omnitrophica bacterium]|nr:M23 family metallopeptidase [Candidatus Omnitrophota bacterium]